MVSRPAPSRLINLKSSEMDDNAGNEDEEDDDEINEMKNLREDARLSTVWRNGGDVKNEVLWKLEKLFSSLVSKQEDEETNEKTYETLLSAHKSVSRATK